MIAKDGPGEAEHKAAWLDICIPESSPLSSWLQDDDPVVVIRRILQRHYEVALHLTAGGCVDLMAAGMRKRAFALLSEARTVWPHLNMRWTLLNYFLVLIQDAVEEGEVEKHRHLAQKLVRLLFLEDELHDTSPNRSLFTGEA